MSKPGKSRRRRGGRGTKLGQVAEGDESEGGAAAAAAAGAPDEKACVREAADADEKSRTPTAAGAPKPEAIIELKATPEHRLERLWNYWVGQTEAQPRKKGAPSSAKSAAPALAYKDVNTVELFWRATHTIKGAAAFPMDCNLSIFEAKVRPEWEDSRNKGGGRWMFQFDTGTQPDNIINDTWEDLCMGAIGECCGTAVWGGHSFDASKEVTGVVLNRRPKYIRFSMWVTDCHESVKKVEADGLMAMAAVKKAIERAVGTWIQESQKSRGVCTKIEYMRHGGYDPVHKLNSP